MGIQSIGGATIGKHSGGIDEEIFIKKSRID
jgi:hypothetical protein